MKFQSIGRSEFVAVIAVALGLGACTAEAQNCSTAETELRARYETAAIRELTQGDLNGYRNVKLSLEQELSYSCRELLDKIEPMRVRCTAQEKNDVLQHYGAVYQAVMNLDAIRVIDLMLHLENSISQQCWIATNRHIDPQIVGKCSDRELDHIASMTGRMLRMSRALATGASFNMDAIVQYSQDLTGPLSQGCFRALDNYQGGGGFGEGGDAGGYGPRNVYDHGGGTYSVPGTGACSSTGCIAY